MALSLVTKLITFGDGSSAPGYFMTDGTNYYPVGFTLDVNGAVMTPGKDSSLASILAAIQGTDTSAAPATSRSGYVNGALSAASVQAAGTAGGFAPGDTLTMPTGAGVTTPAVLNVASTQAVGTPTVASSGSGGGTGAVTLTGTDGTGTKFVCTGTMTSGVLSGVSAPTTVGNYTAAPANANNTSGAGCAVTVTGAGAGTATGVQLYVKFAPLTLGVTTPGVYTAPVTNPIAPASTSGGGSLTGLTVNLNTFSALSTQVAPSNASRQYFALRNESTSLNLGMSLHGAAVLGAVGTTTLYSSGQSFTINKQERLSNVVQVIGQQAFQLFWAEEA